MRLWIWAAVLTAVLGCASAPSAAEADAVRDWVRAAGGLLLITDHYPIGGANQILADRFGVAMSNAWTEDPRHHRKGPQEIVFSREDGLLGDHPITRGLTRVITFRRPVAPGPAGERPSAAAEPRGDRYQDGLQVSAASRSQGPSRLRRPAIRAQGSGLAGRGPPVGIHHPVAREQCDTALREIKGISENLTHRFNVLDAARKLVIGSMEAGHS